MIRVIIKRRVKEGENIGRLLRHLRAEAMPQRGYMTGETLISTNDRNLVTVISTWRSLEDWKKWEKSQQRVRIERQIQALLAEGPLIETYEVMSTEEEEYLEDPSGWLTKKERPSFDG